MAEQFDEKNQAFSSSAKARETSSTLSAKTRHRASLTAEYDESGEFE